MLRSLAKLADAPHSSYHLLYLELHKPDRTTENFLPNFVCFFFFSSSISYAHALMKSKTTNGIQFLYLVRRVQKAPVSLTLSQLAAQATARRQPGGKNFPISTVLGSTFCFHPVLKQMIHLIYRKHSELSLKGFFLQKQTLKGLIMVDHETFLKFGRYNLETRFSTNNVIFCTAKKR